MRPVTERKQRVLTGPLDAELRGKPDQDGSQQSDTSHRSCVDNVQSNTLPSINGQLGGQRESDRHRAR
ncbi:MAG: hypothetical protein RLZZ232_2901 [Planctomycetota bacterium]|jgi:hypothetical protein